MSNAEVLYLTYDGLTDPLGQSQIIPYLEGLAVRGYKIHILSCEKPNRFAKKKQIIKDLLDKSGIEWHPEAYTRKPPVLSTLYDIRKLRSTAKSLDKKYRFRIVHCRSYITAFVGLYLKKKTGAKFVFDMRGFWADERVEGGLWSLKNPVYRTIYKYFKRKEREFLIHADHVVTLTGKSKTEIINKFNLGGHTPSISVIPCCADTNFFSADNLDEDQKHKAAVSLGISASDMIISYSGSIGTWYMPDEMLDFFVQLNKVYANARFLFISHDDPKQVVDAANKRMIDPQKIIFTSAARGEMPLLLSLTNIALFFIRPVYSKMASSPTKMGEIMSMGIPFITNGGIGDVDDVVSRTGAGLLVKDFTASSYMETINKIPALLKISPDEIRKKALDEYDLAHGVDRYYKIYRQLNGN